MDNTKNYFYGIDFLRWFAAFGVVLYHYSLHFKVEEVNYSSFLNFLILNRDFAQQFVWLFWAISGFVFTNIYVHRETNLKNFFISRFARLYPLHFITLIIVMILQFISIKKFGYSQEGYINDLYHFILNIFFASDWGLQSNWNYNVPVWSVSIEIPIYFLFFFTLFYLKKFKLVFSIFIALSCYYLFPSLENLNLNQWQRLAIFNFKTCIFYFFSGSCVYFIYLKLENYRKLLFSIGLFFILISIVFLNFKFNLLILDLFPSTIILILSLILFFACFDYIFKDYAKSIYLLSNTSYSIYLLHFPLQLLILIICEEYSFSLENFVNIFYFLAFLIILQIMALISFLYFETPMRRYLNSKYK